MKRLDPLKANPDAYAAMARLQAHVNASKLEPALMHLVKLRASQINGCAYCIDLHTREARASGESEQRLYLLEAWREAPLYSERERAALAWSEAVTRVADDHVPDAAYEAVRAQFAESELVDLTLALVAINGWNRLCVAFRVPPGHHKPMRVEAGEARP